MDTLRLGFKIRLSLVLRFHALLQRSGFISVNMVVDLGQIRQDEGIRFVGTQEATSLFRQVGIVTLFIHGKEKLLFLSVEHFLGLIGIQHRLGTVHPVDVFRILQQRHQSVRSWLPQLRFVEQKAHFLLEGLGILRVGAIFRLKFLDHLFGPFEKLVAQLLLPLHQRLNGWFDLIKVVIGMNHGRPTDDQRRACFINQDGIDLIHNGEVMTPLNLVIAIVCHPIVTKIIKTELRIRSVGDVTAVLFAAQSRRLIMQDATYSETEKGVNRTHPFAVASCEVVIHGHDMHPTPGQGIEKNR